jgi:hypothetical protein
MLESVLDKVAEGVSPVAGERFPALSKEYRKRKIEEGAPPIPNLDLHGDLWESFSYELTDEGFKLGVFGAEAPKADGHFKFSGKEGTAPKRRAVPGEGQKFKAEIQDEAEAIVAQALAERVEPSRDDFEGIDSARDFWAAASAIFPDMTRPEIAFTILKTPRLKRFFESLDLTRFLG